jgi:hypothetical protein
MATLIPDAWMPSAPMRRVIVHWTAGGYRANDVDRAAYHILVEESGKLVRGTHSIADNVSTADGDYAAHTRGLNTGSIGVSMCCMHNCVRSPFSAGQFPMTERQWSTMLHVVAQLCRRYAIDVTPTAVLGHGEVQQTLGVKQHDKWDPMVLPWNPMLDPGAVGDLLRDAVRELLEPPPRVTVIARGEVIGEDDAFLQDGRVFVAADEVTRVLGWIISGADGEADVQVSADRQIKVPAMHVAGRAFVSGAELAEALDRPVTWDPASRTVTIS